MPAMLDWLPKRYRAPLGVLAAIVAVATFLWQFDSHYVALAQSVAKTTTEATVNKAVIDSVKKAAKEAVDDAMKDKIDDVAQRAADAAVKKYAEQAKPKPPPAKPKKPSP